MKVFLPIVMYIEATNARVVSEIARSPVDLLSYAFLALSAQVMRGTLFGTCRLCIISIYKIPYGLAYWHAASPMAGFCRGYIT